ncbi:MAG: thioredoxin domain-containing protein [Deltaproteobacteria bacterium]|nr:thioredoxin domain-containing protein [Deltaproteobacteria bacterium]
MIHEKSPYLLQHAHNPVAWQPWGPEAFARAQAEDKLVLVSIGYATCHWCHVMERESFEDAELAAYLNANFVAIKVDREERPDVDRQYMEALQALGQQGGWPLNLFTTPDGRPVTGGTYFPPTARYGLRGFREVLEILSRAWKEQRDDVLQNAQELTRHLRERSEKQGAADGGWNHDPIQAAADQYRGAYDAEHGGFTLQPQHKFPPSMGLMLLLRHHTRTGDPQALDMVAHTLRAMRSGGIYDQLGGGLSRYATDYVWRVPHFEKMLYDNALFTQALVEAYQVTGDAYYRAAAEDVIAYIQRDMTLPGGAFCSAEDADSEGVEGRFYVWTPEQISAVLPPEQARAAQAYWNVGPQGNFEHGASVLYTSRTLAQVAHELNLPAPELTRLLTAAREALFRARESRERPLRDDKVLTSWNALMIGALARAGSAFDEPALVRRAQVAAEFLLSHLRAPEGRLLRRWREGEARFPAYLADHAQLALACLDLYEATLEPRWFREAAHLMREVNRLFRNDHGPYHDTGSDAETLLTRGAEGYDGVEPSGNSSAALAFLRLHAYGLHEEGFQDDALRIFGSFRPWLEQAGVSFSALLTALDFHLAPPREVVVVGAPDDPATVALLNEARRRFHPARVLAGGAPEQVAALAGEIPLLRNRSAVGGRPTAYVCRDMSCRLPVHTPEELRALLTEK